MFKKREKKIRKKISKEEIPGFLLKQLVILSMILLLAFLTNIFLIMFTSAGIVFDNYLYFGLMIAFMIGFVISMIKKVDALFLDTLKVSKKEFFIAYYVFLILSGRILTNVYCSYIAIDSEFTFSTMGAYIMLMLQLQWVLIFLLVVLRVIYAVCAYFVKTKKISTMIKRIREKRFQKKNIDWEDGQETIEM